MKFGIPFRISLCGYPKKSKVPPRSGSVASKRLNAVHKKGPSSFKKKKNKQTKKTHEIKPTQKNESELGDIYI